MGDHLKTLALARLAQQREVTGAHGAKTEVITHHQITHAETLRPESAG